MDNNENFRKYAEDMKSDNEAVRQAAQEEACGDLEFYLRSRISRRFGTYIKDDPGFYKDLMQAGKLGIIEALTEYDPDQSRPTTYITYYIKNKMVSQVNTMKHGIRSHVATVRSKMREVDKLFARYGRTPALHDYAYSTKYPLRRIANVLAEIEAGKRKVSIDDPDAAELIGRQSAAGSLEDSALSNMNVRRIMEMAGELEPRKEIVRCFLEMHLDGGVKPRELAEKYGLSPSEITEGVRNLANLLRLHPDMRKMYPEMYQVKADDVFEQDGDMAVGEGKTAANPVMDLLRAMIMGGEELNF